MGFNWLKADIFFIQEYSNLLLERMLERGDYDITRDPTEDSMILVKKNTFAIRNNMDDLFNKIKEEQKEMKWAKSITFASYDNYVIVSAHLSSQK